MPGVRLPLRDPRTVARDIPGVLDILFPRLAGGLVASLNRKAFNVPGVKPIPDERVKATTLQYSMLFELAMTRAEMAIDENPVDDWTKCIQIAVERQRLHFDAKIPADILPSDRELADWAAHNLREMLQYVLDQNPRFGLQMRPVIPGLGWIGTGVGDFAVGPCLIEVKNTDRNFVSGDFRQVLIYWLLKYAASIERDDEAWSQCLLLNPRRNFAISLNFDNLAKMASGGLSRIEALQRFISIVGSNGDQGQ